MPLLAAPLRTARRAHHGSIWGIAGAAALVVLTGCASSPTDITEGKTVTQLYEEAREEASGGTPERAIKIYERLEGLAAGTLLGQQAQLEQAFMLYRQNERGRALAIIERFLKLHPTSPAVDYAYYLQGLINFNDDLGLFGAVVNQDPAERDQQAARDAYESFRQVVDRFPESRYAPDARVRMDYIHNTLAAYELHVARYYFRRGAFVAAANRAQAAVTDYRGAPATEEALYLMASSYERLGLLPLRDDTLRVLRGNFPKSRWLQVGLDTGTRPWWRFW